MGARFTTTLLVMALLCCPLVCGSGTILGHHAEHSSDASGDRNDCPPGSCFCSGASLPQGAASTASLLPLINAWVPALVLPPSRVSAVDVAAGRETVLPGVDHSNRVLPLLI